MKMKKKILLIAVPVLICGAIIGGIVYNANKDLAVQTTTLELKDYAEYHYEEGYVVPREEKTLASYTSGSLSQVLIEKGQEVAVGDLVLVVNHEMLLKELEILEAQKKSLAGQQKAEGQGVQQSQIEAQQKIITLAKEKVKILEKDLETSRSLLEKGAVSQKNYETLEKQLSDAKAKVTLEQYALTTLKQSSQLKTGREEFYAAELEKIQVQISKQKSRIEESKIKATMAGVISEVFVEEGDYVMPNTKLVTILQVDQPEIETFLSVKERRSIEVGQQVKVEYEAGQERHSIGGKILTIDKMATARKSSLGLVEKKVKVMIEPIDTKVLILGEKVDIRFTTYRKAQAKTLSKDYVFPWEEGEATWIVKDGKAMIYPLVKDYDAATSIILGDDVAVDLMIIEPPYSSKLQNGVEVKIQQ